MVLNCRYVREFVTEILHRVPVPIYVCAGALMNPGIYQLTCSVHRLGLMPDRLPPAAFICMQK
jgi:hypothetical protein